MKKYLTILFLIAFITPSVALASWWNPFSWFSNWSFVKKETVPQVQEETQKNLESRINESEKQEQSSTVPPIKEIKKTVSPNNSALIQEQVRIQTEARLRVKAEQDVLIAKQKEAENQAKINALKTELEKQSKELEQLNENVNQISKNTDKIVQNTTKEPEPVLPTLELAKPKVTIQDVNYTISGTEYKCSRKNDAQIRANGYKLLSGCRYDYLVKLEDVTTESKLFVKTNSPDGFHRLGGYGGNQSPMVQEQEVSWNRDGQLSLSFEPMATGSYYLEFSLDGRTTTENFAVE